MTPGNSRFVAINTIIIRQPVANAGVAYRKIDCRMQLFPFLIVIITIHNCSISYAACFDDRTNFLSLSN
ncbi:hypothetical protein L3i20_v247600 [Paenibacillus sp. L3-i20]|nr:hypothetical protein L3i20_v247600 [Paenibacillus sp. L3-i20]